MVSRQNIDGRPRPSGVLPTVQAGPTVGISDPNPTPVGPVSQGPRSGGRTGRRGRGGARTRMGRDGVIPDLNGEGEDFPPPTTPPTTPPTDDTGPYPPGKGPPIMVPPTQPDITPGGSRRGGGAGYRARQGKIARETTEAQEAAGRGGRFGEQHVGRYRRTKAPGSGVSAAQSEFGRRFPTGAGLGPRWSTSEGGGGYGTIPPPLPPPEPPPEEEAPPTGLTDEERAERRRERQERRRDRGPRGRGRLR